MRRSFASLCLSVLPLIRASAQGGVQENDPDAPSTLIRKSQSSIAGKAQRGLQGKLDLSSYALQFVSCASATVERVKFSVPANEVDGSVVEGGYDVQQDYALFRLCPRSRGSETPSSCAADCVHNYGQYVLDLKTYLSRTVDYFQAKQQQYCSDCDTQCAPDASRSLYKDVPRSSAKSPVPNVDCSMCTNECEKIVNMESNGYLDATLFLTCQLIYDPSSDTEAPLYAGPVCARSGTKVTIGVFKDEACRILDPTKEVEEYLVNKDGSMMKLSHALLKQTYTDTCIACESSESGIGSSSDVASKGADKPVCRALYKISGKCETELLSKSDNGTCQRALSQEPYVCDFIRSLGLTSQQQSS